MGKRILVADDSVTIQRAFALVLGVEDVTLIAARSFDDALAAARRERPDLVFADVNLGDRSGYELCAALKNESGLADVPVLILASSQVPYDPERGDKARADGQFIKPFESTKLLEIVSTAKVAKRDTAAVRTTAAPIAVPAEDTSRVAADNFDDEDSYGEFTIEPTAGAPAPVPTPPPVAVRAPASAPPRPPGVMAPRPSAPVPTARPLPAAAPPAMARPSAAMPIAASAPSAPPVRPSAPMPAAASRPAPAPAPMAASSSVPTAPKPPRPSLIPGVMPPRTPEAPAVARPASAPPPSAPMDFGRTMMGMPAAVVSAPDRAAPRPPSGLSASLFEGVDVPSSVPSSAPPSFASSAPAPQAPLADMPTPIGGKPKDAPGLFQTRSDRSSRPESVVPPVSDRLAEKVSDKLTQKMAEVSTRGPEYEAIAKLSREIIEQVVWEVVPELAEVMIREHIERLAAKR